MNAFSVLNAHFFGGGMGNRIREKYNVARIFRFMWLILNRKDWVHTLQLINKQALP